MKKDATVTVPYEDYEALLAELTRLTALETGRKYEGMSLVELTVNGQRGPTGFPLIKGKVVRDGEITETTKEYPRKYMVNPILRVLISEINKMENAVVLVDSNVRKVMECLRTLSEQERDIYEQIRKIVSENNLILITKRESAYVKGGGC